MSGCPFLNFDWKQDCEACKLTDKPTGVSLVCDFDYDDCTIYQKQAAEQQLKQK